jgi:heterodisulfide reductase subunit C
MSLLKEQAFKAKTPGYKKGTAFYGSFMESVRRHGRVRETEFMTLYFMAMKNPLLPFEFAGIGLKLMRKNKVAIQFPSGPDDSNLDRLFKKVKEIEDLKEAGNAQEQYE